MLQFYLAWQNLTSLHFVSKPMYILVSFPLKVYIQLNYLFFTINMQCIIYRAHGTHYVMGNQSQCQKQTNAKMIYDCWGLKLLKRMFEALRMYQAENCTEHTILTLAL